MSWEADLTAVEARLAALDTAAEVHERSLSVAQWRDAAMGSTFYLPIALIAREQPELTGRWLDEHTEDSHADRVGLDDQGRPILALQGPGPTAQRPHYAWYYDRDGFAIEELNFRKRSVRRQSPTVEAVAVNVAVSRAARGLHDVRTLRWEGTRLQRVEGARQVPGLAPAAFAREARWAPDGRLEQIVGETELPDFSQPPPRDALAVAIERGRHLHPSELLWDGRVSDLEPWPTDQTGIAESLASAFCLAIVKWVATFPVDTLAWLDIRLTTDNVSGRPLPPAISAIETTLVETLLRAGSLGLDVIDDAYSSDATHTLPLVDRLDPESLRLCRAVSTATHHSAPDRETRGASALLDAIAGLLADLLAGPARATRVPLALIQHADGSGSPSITEALARARRTAGHKAVGQLITQIGA
jgi:hypothetical protein